MDNVYLHKKIITLFMWMSSVLLLLTINIESLYFRAPTRLIKLCHSDYDDDDDNRTVSMMTLNVHVISRYKQVFLPSHYILILIFHLFQ